MPTSRPAYPTQRAFVVQLHAETDVAQSEVRGRAEHIVSGQVTYFQTLEELAQFMVQVLTSPTAHSQVSDDRSDPSGMVSTAAPAPALGRATSHPQGGAD